MKKAFLKTKAVLFAVIVAILLAFVGSINAQDLRKDDYITIYPAKTDKVLFNPGMGIYIMGEYPDPEFVAGVSKFANIVYRRFTWAELEPEEGQYRFDQVLGDWMKRWRRVGFRVAFGVMSTTLGQSATPAWVFEAGVPGVSHMAGKQVDPVYWDQRYLDQYERFVIALGKYLDGGKGIEFVDMRGIGVWGEMHLGTFIKGMWTTEELMANGFTTQKYVDAHKDMIDMHLKAFPNTRLFLNISVYEELAEYAALKGVGLRYDGLNIEDGNPTSKRVSTIFRKFGYNDVNGPLGVPCNYEFKNWETDPTIIRNTLYAATDEPISYLHANVRDLKNLSLSIENAFVAAAKKLGFRFAINSIKVKENSIMKGNGSTLVPLEVEFVNTGVAPAYKAYFLRFRVAAEDGTLQSIISDSSPDLSTAEWQPGKSLILKQRLTIPKTINVGDHQLTLEIYDRADSGKRIRVDIDGGDSAGKYVVAKFRVIAAGAGTKQIVFLK